MSQGRKHKGKTTEIINLRANIAYNQSKAKNKKGTSSRLVNLGAF